MIFITFYDQFFFTMSIFLEIMKGLNVIVEYQETKAQFGIKVPRLALINGKGSREVLLFSHQFLKTNLSCKMGK